MIHLRRRAIRQGLMRPLVIVVGEVAVESAPGIADRAIRVEIDLLPLDRAPKAFDKDVIQRSTAPIHADAYPLLLQPARERNTGKLGALVGIEDKWGRLR